MWNFDISYQQIKYCRYSNRFKLPGSEIMSRPLKSQQVIIRKTCPCNKYPLKPHFYTVNMGFAGVYLFFGFLLQNIDCGYSLEPSRRGGSNVYPQSMF